jgi:hypothetical protein
MDGMRLELALGQIEFARKYTWSLLEGLRDEDWFRQPEAGVTHLAWQVGHLAMAEYGLCLFRIRGRQPGDTELMSSRFRKAYSRGSVPVADPEKNPSPGEIRDVLERVHAQVQEEAAGYREEDLREAIDEPYAVYANKLGALLFCANHEMLHAGQIGLLRRLLGYSPVR